MRYLLDTTVVIDHALGAFGASQLLLDLLGETGEIFLCDAVVAEALSKGTDEELATIESVIRAFEYVSTSPGAARWAGASRRTLGRNSNRRLADALVAGVAWTLGATVVTRNPRDFEAQGVSVRAYGGQPPAP